MDYQIIIILLLNRRHLSFRYFVVARDWCTSPSCIKYTVKRHACTSSDRIQKILISYERKEGHHNKWWTASREAHSKRVELTSGLSVGMSVPMFVCL